MVQIHPQLPLSLHYNIETHNGHFLSADQQYTVNQIVRVCFRIKMFILQADTINAFHKSLILIVNDTVTHGTLSAFI